MITATINLLVLGSKILAANVVDAGDHFSAPDIDYPKDVVSGASIVAASVPNGFSPANYTWDGSTVVVKPPEVIPVEVPQSVTMRQARLALLGAGLLDSVQSAIDGLAGAAGKAAQIEWEYSKEVHRHKSLTLAIGPALGLTDAQLDALFIAAAKIE